MRLHCAQSKYALGAVYVFLFAMEKWQLHIRHPNSLHIVQCCTFHTQQRIESVNIATWCVNNNFTIRKKHVINIHDATIIQKDSYKWNIIKVSSLIAIKKKINVIQRPPTATRVLSCPKVNRYNEDAHIFNFPLNWHSLCTHMLAGIVLKINAHISPWSYGNDWHHESCHFLAA